MTRSKGIGSSRAVSRNSGSTAKVIALTTPSEPSPIRAAAKISGFSVAEQRSTEPSAVTSSRPLIWAAIEALSRPVPWVPVAVAPATVCSMMSPILASDSPWAVSVSLSCRSGVPAATVTVPASRSSPRTPTMRPGRISSPSVAAAVVKECPEPTAFTFSPSAAARRTTSASS
ncbi:hypothetical protein SANTM175S_05275 [Streptomyces antimycoticus]